MMSGSRIIMRTIKATVGTHVGLTVASIGFSIWGQPPTTMDSGDTNSGSRMMTKDTVHEAFDSKHYQYVTNFVTHMYSNRRGRIDRDLEGVKLDDDVSYEDPVAICKSKEEVQEVFRVLQRYLDPI